MIDCQIINARIPRHTELQRIWIENGIITNLDSQLPDCDLPIIDVNGDYISLGGIDLQINGALGLAFPDVTLEDFPKLDKICDLLWNQGVDGFLPTIVTTSLENIHRSLSVFNEYINYQKQRSPFTAEIVGIHLEGPFLNYEKRGAHPEAHLRSLNLKEIKRVLGEYGAIVKIITLAPELDHSGEVIPFLTNAGITVSLGHSMANLLESQRAFSQGATMVTHAFNAMPSLHHREPGLLGVALTTRGVKCGFIADGQHIHPVMLKLLCQTSGDGLFLVSDALSPLGLADGKYPWDDREIEVIEGTARLLDGTLSGTTLPLFAGVENLVKWGITDVERAIDLATSAPREAIKLNTDYRRSPANLIRWKYQSENNHLSWERLR
jgi:N-acetylglucosamine-6-phosphate deacetylase